MPLSCTLSTGSALLCCPGDAAGLGLGKVPLQAAGERQGEEGFFLSLCHHMADKMGLTCSPILTPSGPAHPCPFMASAQLCCPGEV